MPDRRTLVIAAVMIALIVVAVAAMAYNLTSPKNQWHREDVLQLTEGADDSGAWVVITYDQEYDSYLIRLELMDEETGKWTLYRDTDKWISRKVAEQIFVKIGKVYLGE
jgi:anti-sigma-K factor RskA